MPSSPLESVTFVLRHQPGSGALQQVAATISSFLGPAPSLSLGQAFSFDSMKLLEWIWDSSCTSTTDRTPGWSLVNYLRSDPHYNRYQFAQSMKVAADRSDLELVKWLYTRFSGCEGPLEAPAAAARLGNLAMLQFLWAHDPGHHKKEGVKSVKRRKVDIKSGAYGATTAHWGSSVMEYAEGYKHAHIAQWLRDNLPGE